MFVMFVVQSWKPWNLGFFQKGEWQGKVWIAGDWEQCLNTVWRVKTEGPNLFSFKKQVQDREEESPRRSDSGQMWEHRGKPPTNPSWPKLIHTGGWWGYGSQSLHAVAGGTMLSYKTSSSYQPFAKGKEEFWLRQVWQIIS